jgi:hypothetical protein
MKRLFYALLASAALFAPALPAAHAADSVVDVYYAPS